MGMTRLGLDFRLSIFDFVDFAVVCIIKCQTIFGFREHIN